MAITAVAGGILALVLLVLLDPGGQWKNVDAAVILSGACLGIGFGRLLRR